MKKIIILIISVLLSLPCFAFEIPAGKTINKVAVENGIENFTQKIKSNPNLEEAYINRAFLYFLSDNIPAAIAAYNTLISINPNNEEYYLNRGYLKHISHKREEALKDYDMALKIKPDYAFAHNNRGVALSELGRNKESLIAYNTAIKIDPNYADAYYNRGNLNTKTEHNEEALDDFNIAIKLNPTDSASFNNRGVVKRKLNYNIGALSDFSIAIKLNPEDITAFANRGRLKKRYYDSEGAEEDFKNAIAVAEKSPKLIKEIEDQTQLAITKIQANKQNTELNNSKLESDNIQKIAHNTLEKNKESSIKVATVRAGVLKVDPKTNRVNEITNAQKVNSTPNIDTKPVSNPQLAECYYIRALQKYILQNRESALNDFNKAIQYNPNYAEAYYYRAAIKRDLQDEGFVDDYKKAITINPSLKSIDDNNILTILKIQIVEVANDN